ncbi:unnamed protein product [Closterium sp. NIES-64]|nr:unnamed protein product [Closterium sp. NIES-64]
MSPTLEDQERHLLVKVIDRILYKLDELVRPFVHKILVVIEPLLIDEDYYARVEGREIISNLSKATGLATMIAAMRPDIDNVDEYVRNTTARAFSVVASALGIPALLPFLRAVCASKKSWQARHTGIKIVQQIAILMGCAVLPHLRSLVDIIEHGLGDDNQKVRVGVGLCMCVDSIIELSLACEYLSSMGRGTTTTTRFASHHHVPLPRSYRRGMAPYSIESFYFVLSLTTIPSMSPSLPSPPSPLCLSPPVPITCPPSPTSPHLSPSPVPPSPTSPHLSPSPVPPSPPVPITCPPSPTSPVPHLSPSHLSPPVPPVSPPLPITCPPLSHLSPPVPITCPPLSHLSPPVPITCPPLPHLSPPVPITSPHLSPPLPPVPPSPTSPSPIPVSPPPPVPTLTCPPHSHLSPPVPITCPPLSHLSPPVPITCPPLSHLSPPVPITCPPSPTSPRLSPSLRCALSQRSLWQRWQRRQHSLAEASAPYGIESFDSVLKPLWKGIRAHRGKVLAAFLKAIGFIIPLMDAMYASYYNPRGGSWGHMCGVHHRGLMGAHGAHGGICVGFIIPLMDAMYASYYTREVMVVLIREFQSPDKEMKKIVLKVVMVVLIREFQSPDEEMKKIVLKVVKQCVGTDGVEPDYIRTEILPEYFKHFWQEILPEYFKHFWVRRMALDRRNYKQLVETMVKIANKVWELGIEGGEGGVWAGAGVSDIIGRVVEDLKDESEPYRRMVMETVEKVLTNLGAADIDARLEELLIDGILYAFQEQVGVCFVGGDFLLYAGQRVHGDGDGGEVLTNLGAADIDARLEELLIDGILYAFQERTSDDANVMLNGFGTVVNALGQRVRPYLPQICGTVKWRLKQQECQGAAAGSGSDSAHCRGHEGVRGGAAYGAPGVVLYEYLGEARVRQQAADLIARIAVVMKACGEEQLMGHLGVVLYEAVVMKACGEEQLMRHLGVVLCEYLGEEYPEVLGSILGALKVIVNVIGMTKRFPSTPCCSYPHINAHPTCVTLSPNCAMPLPLPPEYPEVLGSILGALKAIVNVIGMTRIVPRGAGVYPGSAQGDSERDRMTKMTPPIKDLLPRLTPILKKQAREGSQAEPSFLQSVSSPVQENCVDLVGRIAGTQAKPLVSPILNTPPPLSPDPFPPSLVFHQHYSTPQVQKKCIADRQSEPSSLQSVSLPVCVLPTPLTPPPYDFPTTPHYHSQVQENCIDLVGRIADRGAEFVPAREWMRICFELLDMLKAHKKGTRGATVNTAHKKGIRRATVNTFGYIAKAIGPQDVLATLLNNLKVQERQNRVCTTVAIAIVAETCSPFTVLPALMNEIEVSDGGAEQPQGAGAAEPRVHHRALVAETCSSFTVLPALMSEYRVPELNVQNGVLKSACF